MFVAFALFAGMAPANFDGPDIFLPPPSEYACVCGEPCTQNGATGTCGADGATCANWFAPVVCETTSAPQQCPDGCSGVQSRMMNFACEDGSIGGPTCEEPSCEWYVCPMRPRQSVACCLRRLACGSCCTA